MSLTTKVRSRRPGPCCLPLAIAVISGKLMSERIDVRGDITIAGTSGDAVHGEVRALTRWVPAGQAVRSPAGAVAHRASGCAQEFAANGADPREPHRRRRPGRPGSAAMTAAHRGRECYTRCVLRLARLRLLAGDGAGEPLPPGAAGEVGQAAGAIVAETGAAGQAAVAASRKAAAVPRRCSWRPGRPGWRPRPMRSPRRRRTAAPPCCRGRCAGSRRSPRRYGRCSPICGPRRRPPARAPGRTGSRMRTPDRGPAASAS